MKPKATRLLQIRVTPGLMRSLHAQRRQLDMTMKEMVTAVLVDFVNTRPLPLIYPPKGGFDYGNPI